MKYRTEIDLNKMNPLGRIIYIQALIRDASDTIKELKGDSFTYDHIEHLIEHLDQAVIDLRKVQP